jgi:hypothetical protein
VLSPRVNSTSVHVCVQYFDDNYGSRGASEEDPYNVEDCGLTDDERAAVSRGWQDNTKAVGEMVVSKGGWPYPYFELASRNETRPDVTCQRDMQAMCKVNATTKRPNIHDQCLLLEFSRVSHMSENPSCFEFSIWSKWFAKFESRLHQVF